MLADEVSIVLWWFHVSDDSCLMTMLHSFEDNRLLPG